MVGCLQKVHGRESKVGAGLSYVPGLRRNSPPTRLGSEPVPGLSLSLASQPRIPEKDDYASNGNGTLKFWIFRSHKMFNRRCA